ncbi:MAG TPA: hypothetical protein VIH90_05060 [Candidatus Saccharimonadales bacterium]
MSESDTNTNFAFDHQSTVSSSTTKIQPIVISDIVRPGGNPLSPKAPTRSNTLMRNVVNKPNLKPEPKITAQAMLITEPATIVAPKQVAASVDHDREKRAKINSQSELISRFRATASTDPQPSVAEPMVEAQIPVSKPVPEQPPQLYKPLDPRVDQPSMSIIEKSLAAAPVYEVPKIHKKAKSKKSKAKKVMSYALVASLLIVLGGGIFAYKNFDRIGFYVASSQAGFHATLPGYNPSGYSMTNVSSASGIIQSNFKSNSDSRNYSLNEKTSNWSSDDLLNNYVSGVSSGSYQTINSGGKTIYIYGDRNATWVSKGIWYVITSNASLSDNQLVQIATTT